MDDQRKLYTPADIQTMKVADEARLNGQNRIEELKNYARKSGVKRIGIAHCIAFQKEANVLKTKLENEFEVYSIDCKVGKIAASDLIGSDAKGISCNPSGQAEYLATNKTELNVSIGLCMGHDILFNQKSKAPTTTLLTKDRENRQNAYKAFEVE